METNSLISAAHMTSANQGTRKHEASQKLTLNVLKQNAKQKQLQYRLNFLLHISELCANSILKEMRKYIIFNLPFLHKENNLQLLFLFSRNTLIILLEEVVLPCE